MEKQEQISKLAKYRKQVLTERENLIITKRFGLDGGEEKTQREIAEEIGISRSYVSRIEKRALEKMKRLLLK
jgi:RNA polymerase sporulation-specific sigma factor